MGPKIQGSFKVLEKFRRKKKAANTTGSLGMTAQDTNLKSKDDEDRDPPRYFRKPKEEEEIRLTEVLSGLLQRLKSLDRERTEVVEEIYRLGEEAEKQAEELEKELSTLKKQTTEFEEVLSTIHAHRRVVRR
jgi:seryl-tRNA synthetase